MAAGHWKQTELPVFGAVAPAASVPSARRRRPGMAASSLPDVPPHCKACTSKHIWWWQKGREPGSEGRQAPGPEHPHQSPHPLPTQR